jgi:hypothetical protein
MTPVSQSIFLETADSERLSLGWHNVEGLHHLVGRCTLMIYM